MANLRNEIDSYLQNLLALQFKASSGISHNLTKGELREKFVKQVVNSQYPNVQLKSGILTHDDWQSSQGDFIWLKANARVLVGMFCYATDATDKTVLKKFGFQYDKDLQGYCAYDATKDIFKEINFLYSLNIGEDGTPSPYIVIRDIFGNCSLYNANPVIANFFKQQ